MKRAEKAKLESYVEQREFQLTKTTNNFQGLMESCLHQSNERHIQVLELADKNPGSCLSENPGIARHSDDFCSP